MSRKYHFGSGKMRASPPLKKSAKSRVTEHSLRKGLETRRAGKVKVTLPRVRFLEGEGG